ncbi:ABC1-domain-containing protein [Crepidotus variabilis]|uniref:ABC1-domain-containing protein n=1 Tax=Crepidotus variabilis TaxID=179855 RepID=A0A9P6JUZ6_9AGAR|nr:ABC1-domain-containing protein [Crepidotus variabilis]
MILSDTNIKRLVHKLTKMHGAALKIGQFLSIQDTHILPPSLDSIFRQVQDAAHYMPYSQLEEEEEKNRSPFIQFTPIPFASASIGQVHSALLSPSAYSSNRQERGYSGQHKTRPKTVKVQFLGIKESIKSDLSYVSWLLSGLFLDRTIEVMSSELQDECSYTLEASYLRLFASPSFLGSDPRFRVPWVWDGSTDTVLVMEMFEGERVGGERIASLTIELCLLELFKFHTMQTNPNFSNFLYNIHTRRLGLVDFGATRVYGREFMKIWRALLEAAVYGDEQKCREMSREVGYFVDGESETMINTHLKSLSLLATPFKPSTSTSTLQPFSFAPDSEWGNITAEIRSLIPVMLQERLTPPPREAYSLNRKLSGAFLLASRLNARVDTRAIWEKVLASVDGIDAGASASAIAGAP